MPMQDKAGTENNHSAASKTPDDQARTRQVFQQAHELRDEAMEVKNQVVEAARARARTAFQQQQENMAEVVKDVASVLHQAAQQLSQSQRTNAASYADSAAVQIEYFAESLRERNIDEMIGDLENYARRQPEVFISGAFALGFLAARFVKNANEKRGVRPHSETSQMQSEEETAKSPPPAAPKRSAVAKEPKEFGESL